MKNLKRILEINAFGVCTYLGEKAGIATSQIRLLFVYTSFLTFGSPVLLYLFFAFMLNIRQAIRLKKRNPIRDF